MAGTFVYVISGDHGRHKIGVSDNPQQRLRELQTGSPFPLRLEFVGQTEGEAFAIEGDAHFMLHQHRQAGEWFMVPAEMAIAAVLAAARRLGHQLKPVDPAQITIVSPSLISKNPIWLNVALIPFIIPTIYWIFAVVGPQVKSGEMPLLAAFIEGAFILGCLKLVQWVMRRIGNYLIGTATSFDRLMHPDI